MKVRKHEALKVHRSLGLVALAIAMAGCGGQDQGDDDWQPTGVGPAIDTESQALVDPTAGSLGGDLVPVAPPASKDTGGVERVQSALSSKDSDPKVFYLFYADGKALPSTEYDACNGATPPKFNCSFAPTLAECQRQVQAYLDKWYADLNVVFTLTRPRSGKFYTEVVSSGGGAWCNVAPKVAGVAPFLCDDIQGGVAYTFLGGQSAKQTAIIIAQEQAHLVGLEHVASTTDLMYPSICTDCDGFVNKDLPVDGDRCDRTTQNSYAMMKDRLGAWGGGPKPSVFGCTSDTVPPTVKILDPSQGDKTKRAFTLKAQAKDDCNLAQVQVQVSPLGLKATSYSPPFEWDLANISGHQTITVTAVDGFGHVSKDSITIDAPMDTGTLNATAPNMAGCAVATSAFGVAGALPALGVLLLFSRRRQAPRRRRAVTGALGAKEL